MASRLTDLFPRRADVTRHEFGRYTEVLIRIDDRERHALSPDQLYDSLQIRPPAVRFAVGRHPIRLVPRSRR